MPTARSTVRRLEIGLSTSRSLIRISCRRERLCSNTSSRPASDRYSRTCCIVSQRSGCAGFFPELEIGAAFFLFSVRTDAREKPKVRNDARLTLNRRHVSFRLHLL